MEVNKALSGFCIITSRYVVIDKTSFDKFGVSSCRDTHIDIKRHQISELKKIKKTVHHKDPQDALGKCIGEINIDEIEKNIDCESISEYFKRIISLHNGDIDSALDRGIFLYVCERYDTTIREIVSTMLEKIPEYFDFEFLKYKIKPFIVSLQKDKVVYETKPNRIDQTTARLIKYLR